MKKPNIKTCVLLLVFFFFHNSLKAAGFKNAEDTIAGNEIAVIDLTGVNFSPTHVQLLSGTWKLFRNALLLPAETKDYSPELISIPLNEESQMRVFGYATYQVDLHLPEKHSQLSIFFPVISTASKIWIDDTEVFENGIVGFDKQDHRGALGHVIINLPDHRTKLTLTIQVSNYSYYAAGILADPQIGNSGLLHRKLSVEKAWYNLFAGSLIALAIIHLMLFGLYRREKAYLLLALICICVSVRTFVLNKGSLFFPDLFPFIEMEYFKKLEYFSVYLLLILFPWYVFKSFRGRCPTVPVNVFSIIGLIFSMAALITPITVYTGILDAAHLVFLAEFIFAGYVLFINRLRSDTKIILLGILVSFPFILMEMLSNSGIVSLSFHHLVELGVLLFFLFQSLLLAKRNAKAFHMAENLNRTLEVQVEERTKELSSSNQVKDSLLSIVSHDLKSPINSLKGVLQLFNNGHISETELKPIMARMEKDVNNTLMLLDNVLTWSSSHQEAIRITLTKLRLYSITQEYFQIFNQQAKLKNITLVNAVNPEVFVKADENVIRLVLRNLLSNAIKYTPGDGIVEVMTLEKDDKIQLMVKDNGIGMPAETLQKIFHESICSSPGTEEEKGHGLGLSLCKTFLTKMGAQIHVRSLPQHGTTFSVLLEPVYSLKV